MGEIYTLEDNGSYVWRGGTARTNEKMISRKRPNGRFLFERAKSYKMKEKRENVRRDVILHMKGQNIKWKITIKLTGDIDLMG